MSEDDYDEDFGWGDMTKEEWRKMYERTCSEVQMSRLSDDSR